MRRRWYPFIQLSVSVLWKRREPRRLGGGAAGTSDREQKLAGNVTALRIRSLKDRAALADDRAVARDWAELKKRCAIARDAEIFAPLAHRLGLWTFKAELEDWAFRYAHPGPYAALEAALEVRRSRYESALKGSRKALEARLAADPKLRGVKVSVSGRTKELYSLWLKMERAVEERRDAHAEAPKRRRWRRSRRRRWRALGRGREGGHGPAFGSFELEDAADAPYVLDDQDLDGVRRRRAPAASSSSRAARPCRASRTTSPSRPNGYQSPTRAARREAEDQVVEVQIRTAWMHEVAEHGMAAHWLYKDGLFSVEDLDDDGEPADGRWAAKPYAVSWLNSVKDWQHEIHSSREFVETIRKEVLGKRVFVFLRDGQILDLSRGATLSYELKNGDVVSVSTSEDAPQLDWPHGPAPVHAAKLRAYFREERDLRGREAKTIDSAM
ncbi:hypothetical protein JL720_17193 [Aureococcus anophagefferens]|nr:hypothetical protein JL720_17193 [Aureococcus anophagefferens]